MKIKFPALFEVSRAKGKFVSQIVSREHTGTRVNLVPNKRSFKALGKLFSNE